MSLIAALGADWQTISGFRFLAFLPLAAFTMARTSLDGFGFCLGRRFSAAFDGVSIGNGVASCTTLMAQQVI